MNSKEPVSSRFIVIVLLLIILPSAVVLILRGLSHQSGGDSVSFLSGFVQPSATPHSCARASLWCASSPSGCCGEGQVCLKGGCCDYDNWAVFDTEDPQRRCCMPPNTKCGTGHCCLPGEPCILNSTRSAFVCCPSGAICGPNCCLPGQKCSGAPDFICSAP